MPREGAQSWREGREQGGLRARDDHSPNLPWFPLTTLKSHLLLCSDALLVPLPPGWVVQVLESLISRRDSRGTANLEGEQSFRKTTGKLAVPAAGVGSTEGAAFPRS